LIGLKLSIETIAAVHNQCPRFADLGLEIFPREQQTPEALGALLKAETEKWWPIIKAAGIKAE
jgi:chaperone required for assembly of F1-ATPase